MMAMAIFGLVAVGLVQVLHTTAEAARAARVDMHVIRNLQSFLTEVGKMDNFEEVPEPFGPDEYGVIYTFEVEEMELETEEGQPLTDMFHIIVTADWERHGIPDSIQADTFRYVPLYQQAQ
jgi:type II secretory pathway component PulJ